MRSLQPLTSLLVCLSYCIVSTWAQSHLAGTIYSSTEILAQLSWSTVYLLPLTLQVEQSIPNDRDSAAATVMKDLSSSRGDTQSQTSSTTTISSGGHSTAPITSPILQSSSKSTSHSTTTHLSASSSSRTESTNMTATTTLSPDTTSTTMTLSTSTISMFTSLNVANATGTTSASNSTMPATPTPQSNMTTIENTYPVNQCPPGSSCAWKVGVGIGFGSACATIALFFGVRRYKKHMKESQDEHQMNWTNRGWAFHDVGLPGSQETTMKTTDTRASDGTYTYSRRNDELFQTQNAQRIVDKAVSIQQQIMPLIADNYASVRWQPLPDYRLEGIR